MGGTIIKTRAQIILERGIEQGLAQGLTQGRKEGEIRGEIKGEIKGKIKSLSGLVKKQIITLAQAAEECSLSVDDFIEQCKKYNLNI